MNADHEQSSKLNASGNACPIPASPFDRTTDSILSRLHVLPDSRHFLVSRFMPASGIVVRS